MSNFPNRLLPLLPLSSMEQLLQYAFQAQIDPFEEENQSQLSDFLQTQQQKDTFHALRQLSAEADVLPDSVFFPPKQDVSLTIHPRFLPRMFHRHDFIEIQYVLCGKFDQIIDGHLITLSAGDMCLLSPLTIHGPCVADGNTLLINLLIRVDTLQAAFPQSLSDWDILSEFFMRVLYGKTYNPFLLCKTGDDPFLQNLILDMIEDSIAPDSYSGQYLNATMELLFIHLLRNHIEDFSLGRGSAKVDQNIQAILRYIQEHFTTVSLSELAHQFNYNEVYLSKLIKDYTGVSFSKTVTDLKMRYTAVLLTTSAAPIHEVMHKAGYGEKSHFYKIFHAHYSMTPAQYRKAHTIQER